MRGCNPIDLSMSRRSQVRQRIVRHQQVTGRIKPHGSLADKGVDHRSTVRASIEWTVLAFLLWQWHLRWIAENEINFFTGWKR